jgi:ankyrin repeat protein
MDAAARRPYPFQRMKPIHFRRAALALLCSALPALAQPSPGSPDSSDDSSSTASAMTANMCLGKLFGTNAVVANCDWDVLSDDFKEHSTQRFMVLDGKMRQEIDMSQLKNQEMPPEAMKSMGIDQQIYIFRPDLKTNYVIYPHLKAYLNQPLPKREAAREPIVEKTKLGKEDLNGHPCEKTKVVITTGSGKKWEMFVWFASDLRDIPLRIRLTEEDSSTAEVYTFKDIQFTKPDANLFEPPATFTAYASLEDFETMLEKTQSKVEDVADTNAPSVARLAPIVDYTFQNGTNRAIGPITAKALGLGKEKIPSMQILVGLADHTVVYQFGVSLQNSNDILVARINRETRSGVIWLTSPSGVVRGTFLSSTNGAPIPAPAGYHANEFAEEINTLLQFVTPQQAEGPPPWEDAPHPLVVAAKYGEVQDVEKIFKQDPGAINRQDDEGMTPLAGAVVQENVGVVTFLLDHGADPNIPNKNGLTPLEHACGRDKANALVLAQLLISKGALVNATNVTGFTIEPLDWAVTTDNLDLVNLLLEHGAVIEEHCLATAADRGDADIAEVLIAHGANANAKDKGGNTALHSAAWSGQEDVMKVLLAHGADPDPKCSDGRTPLIDAAGSGASRHGKGCVELLLDRGANVNATDGDGETPLHKAAYYGNSDVVELLLAHGASINATNKRGQTPLQVAQKPEIAELLKQHGAK